MDPLKYQKPPQASSAAGSDEMLTLKIRSKEPESEKRALGIRGQKSAENSAKLRRISNSPPQSLHLEWSCAILPTRERHLESALEWAKEGKGTDKHGYREEFIRLIHRAISISD